MTKRYKFISWNVNGIRAVDKKEALKWVDDYNIDIQEFKRQNHKKIKYQIQYLIKSFLLKLLVNQK